MKFGLNKTDTDSINAVFQTYPNVSEVIVFGSRALGNEKQGSDIDLAIKGDISFEELASIKAKLDQLSIPFFFDIICYEQINNSHLLTHIKQHGQLLWKK